MQEVGSRKEEEAGRAAPVRGTQSFVRVMAEVWSRPGVVGMEVLWRWLPWVVLLTLYALLTGVEHVLGIGVMASPQLSSDLASVQAATVFQPVAAVHTVVVAWNDFVNPIWPLWRWLLPTLFMAWNVLAAVGRTKVLRRFDATLKARRGSLFLLGLLRSSLLVGGWWVWVQFVLWAVRAAITGPAERGGEASLVLFCAMLICGTLLLYVVWGIVSWFLWLAPLLAMRLNLGVVASLRVALGSGAVRGKLIEINLVMNIVRIALIVLAMVFSASPLPFSSVETQTFLTCWWCGVGVVWMVMSDYFHVVRMVAYLRLWRVYDSSAAEGAPGVEAAS